VDRNETTKLFVSRPKFKKHRFFSLTWRGFLLINEFSDCRYFDQFRRYSRSKFKVVRNRSQLRARKILRVQAAKFFYQNSHPCLAGHHVDKFDVVIPTRPKVTLNCAPMFKFLLPQILFSKGAPKFLDLTYNAPPIAHHLAKFHGDRSTVLGDFAPKRKKAIALKVFGEPASKVCDLHCLSKLVHSFSITWQSFVAIGTGSSEI